MTEILVAVLSAYIVAGAGFALAFVAVGIARIDPAAKGSGVWFRILVLPGSIAFWPLLLSRWIAAGQRGDKT